jgi:hypothetical protein
LNFICSCDEHAANIGKVHLRLLSTNNPHHHCLHHQFVLIVVTVWYTRITNSATYYPFSIIIDIKNIVVFLGDSTYIPLVKEMGVNAFYDEALGECFKALLL